MSTPRTLRTKIALLAFLVLPLSACKAVDFTEKRHFADPIMDFDDGGGETHFLQKSFYSREGSAGGIGSSAGGGCGCY
jgi:hypothetical protein